MFLTVKNSPCWVRLVPQPLCPSRLLGASSRVLGSCLYRATVESAARYLGQPFCSK